MRASGSVRETLGVYGGFDVGHAAKCSSDGEGANEKKLGISSDTFHP